MPWPVFRSAAQTVTTPPAQTKQATQDTSIHIRVGQPFVARGPAGNIADNWLSEIRLPNGKFRAFTANAATLAIDGNAPFNMGGPGVTVLKPGPAGSPSACGQWIQHAEIEGKTLLAWVHGETACNYSKGQPMPPCR